MRNKYVGPRVQQPIRWNMSHLFNLLSGRKRKKRRTFCGIISCELNKCLRVVALHMKCQSSNQSPTQSCARMRSKNSAHPIETCYFQCGIQMHQIIIEFKSEKTPQSVSNPLEYIRIHCMPCGISRTSIKWRFRVDRKKRIQFQQQKKRMTKKDSISAKNSVFIAFSAIHRDLPAALTMSRCVDKDELPLRWNKVNQWKLINGCRSDKKATCATHIVPTWRPAMWWFPWRGLNSLSPMSIFSWHFICFSPFHLDVSIHCKCIPRK